MRFFTRCHLPATIRPTRSRPNRKSRLSVNTDDRPPYLSNGFYLVKAYLFIIIIIITSPYPDWRHTTTRRPESYARSLSLDEKHVSKQIRRFDVLREIRVGQTNVVRSAFGKYSNPRAPVRVIDRTLCTYRKRVEKSKLARLIHSYSHRVCRHTFPPSEKESQHTIEFAIFSVVYATNSTCLCRQTIDFMNDFIFK